MMEWILPLGGLVVLLALIWLFWPKIGPKLFGDSETLLWARLQMLGGVIVAADLTPLLQAAGLSRWVGVYVLASGIVTELARKSRTEGGVLTDNLTPIPPKAP